MTSRPLNSLTSRLFSTLSSPLLHPYATGNPPGTHPDGDPGGFRESSAQYTGGTAVMRKKEGIPELDTT